MGDYLTHLRYTINTHRYATEFLHYAAHHFSKGRLLAMGGGGYNPLNTAKAWVEVIKILLEPTQNHH